jgi:CRISPR/Cas system-associated exonuclease Cas4 (RecB family)
MFGGELTFDEDAHAYQFDGKFVPGVTTILSCIGKPALVPWAAGMASDHFLEAIKSGRTDYSVIHKESKSAHRKKSKEAANIGQNVHNYAECVFKNLPAPELLTDQAKRGVEAFHNWYDSHKIKIMASERRVFSQKHYYAGTCDFVAEIDGVIGVGDIKTSSSIYPEMRLQTAAYQQALQEEKGVEFPVRWIIRFDKKTGEFEAKSFYDFELDFSGFEAALKLHRALQNIEGEK